MKYLRAVWIVSTLYPLGLFVLPIGGMLSMLGASYFMVILGFPLSVPSMAVFPLMNMLGVNELTGSYLAVPAIVWLMLFMAGYYQWFVLGPKVADAIIKRFDRGTTIKDD